jgi:hypothetical protein
VTGVRSGSRRTSASEKKNLLHTHNKFARLSLILLCCCKQQQESEMWSPVIVLSITMLWITVPLVIGAASPYESGCGHDRDQTSGSIPWLVSMQFNSGFGSDWFHFCAGAILSPNVILTSASCGKFALEQKIVRVVKGFDKATRKYYGWSRSVYDMSVGRKHLDFDVILHPLSQVSGTRDDNNIAILLKRDDAIRGVFYEEQTPVVGPVCLPDPYEPDPSAGSTVNSMGWEFAVKETRGKENAIIASLGLGEKVRFNRLNVLDRGSCPSFFNDEIDTCPAGCQDMKVEEEKKRLCLKSAEAGKTAVCAGDDGGPVVQQINGRYHVIGIITRARPCDVSPDKPASFLRLRPFVQWIKSVAPAELDFVY